MVLTSGWKLIIFPDVIFLEYNGGIKELSSRWRSNCIFREMRKRKGVDIALIIVIGLSYILILNENNLNAEIV